jgi:import receptor subunit TOM70
LTILPHNVPSSDFKQQRRKQIAGELKTRGNKAYSAKKYKEAIDIYSKAIECDEQAVYFSNRAACMLPFTLW